eukprot:SM000286S10647  [mRNA]  locus=s286:334:1587:+ [translate_table: standard]
MPKGYPCEVKENPSEVKELRPEAAGVVASPGSDQTGSWLRVADAHAAGSEVAAARDLFGVSFSAAPGSHVLVLRSERLVVECQSSVQALMEKLQLYRHRLSLLFEWLPAHASELKFLSLWKQPAPPHGCSEASVPVCAHDGRPGTQTSHLPWQACANQGFEYLWGDFVVRVAKAALSTTDALRGVLVEARAPAPHSLAVASWFEYLPVAALPPDTAVLQEVAALWKEAAAAHGLGGRFVELEPPFGEYGLSERYSLQHAALQYVLVSSLFLASARSCERALPMLST